MVSLKAPLIFDKNGLMSPIKDKSPPSASKHSPLAKQSPAVKTPRINSTEKGSDSARIDRAKLESKVL